MMIFLRASHRGITLFEVLVAIAVAGLMAIITIPKISTPLEERQSTIIARGDAIKTQMALVHESSTTLGGAPDVDDYEVNFAELGTYLAMKRTFNGVPYALLNDGSRVIFRADMLKDYLQSTGLSEIAATTEINKLADPREENEPDPGPATTDGCGDFSRYECFFLDVNGDGPPNTIGERGDIIPFRMDPATGSVSTLYQAQSEINASLASPYTQNFLCTTFGSSYDYFVGNCPPP